MSRKELLARISALEQIVARQSAELSGARPDSASSRRSHPKNSQFPPKRDTRRDSSANAYSQKSTSSRADSGPKKGPGPQKHADRQHKGMRAPVPPKAEVYHEPFVTEEEWANPQPWEL